MNQEMTPVLKSWQFFLSCRRILGDTFLTTLFNRGQRQIYRWSADPDFNSPEGNERNPLDRLKTVLERLTERGRFDVAMSALTILANAIGCEIQPTHPIVPDQETIETEMLDDYPAILKLHESIRSKESDEAVMHCCSEAKRELDETLCKYTSRLKG